MLPAWRPVPSFASTMVTFLIFGVIFLTLGVALFVMSDKIQEKTIPYDHTCGAPSSKQTACTIEIKVKEEI